jgi:cysteine desulfurase/selenocysteine lyase
VAVLGHEAHSDVTTHIEHAAAHTLSTQLFKHVAGGKSRAVYQGKITVREGAIGSDSRQTARALLMSQRAEADLKPELIIFADDVKCAHGATVGDLDVESMFYLRSRGIPEKEARQLLVHAFLQEAVDAIGQDDLIETIWRNVEHAAAARHGGREMSFVPPKDDFPILAKPVNGKRLAYLDSAASAQKPKVVLDAMTEFATTEYANVHRGVHHLAAVATERYEAARVAVARFLNAKHSGRDHLHQGRHRVAESGVVCVPQPPHLGRRRNRAHQDGAPFQHRAVAFHAREQARGSEVGRCARRRLGQSARGSRRRSPPRPSSLPSPTCRTCSARSHPLKEIIQPSRMPRVCRWWWTAARARCTRSVDVQDLDADFYAFTGHKLYGPTGIGVLYGKRAHLKTMRPFQGGGEMIAEVAEDKITYAEPPAPVRSRHPADHRSGRTGGRDQIYVKQFDRAAVKEYELDLYQYAREAGRAASNGCASSARRRKRAPSCRSRRLSHARPRCRHYPGWRRRRLSAPGTTAPRS